MCLGVGGKAVMRQRGSAAVCVAEAT